MVETERLILRPVQNDDAEDLFALWSDPEVMRFIGNGKPRTRAETEERLRRAVRHWQEHGFGLWALHDRATGSFVGGCGVGYFHGLADVELGYALARPYWGRGLASEAVARVLRYAFDALRLPRLVALVRAENEASLAVLRKAGMVCKEPHECEGKTFLLYTIENGRCGSSAGRGT
jgi:ribosomal-protein-alanine N-acetyltransferase